MWGEGLLFEVSVEVVYVQTLTREELIAENGLFREKITLLEAKVSWFEEQFKLARARQFGSSSEAIP